MKGTTQGIIFFLVETFISLGCYSQKVEIVNRSALRHNYVVASFDYIERPADTSRIKYIATLRMQVDGYPYILTNIVGRFRTESRELGGNTFYLDSYSEKDSSVTVTVKIYFATQKFLDENKTYRNKNKIYVFSSKRKKEFKQGFFLNDSLVVLPSTHYYSYTPAADENVRVAASRPKPGAAASSKKNIFKAGRDSRFVIVGRRPPDPNRALVGMAVGPVGRAVYEGAQDGTYDDMDYSVMRMLLEIYPVFTK